MAETAFEEQFDIIETEPGVHPLMSSQQTMQVLESDETDLIYSGKTVDYKTFKPKHHLATFAGQGFLDGIANTLIDMPATLSTLAGKAAGPERFDLTPEQIEEFEKGAEYKLFGIIPIGRADPVVFPEGWKEPRPPQEPDWRTRVGEKVRNFGIALRSKIDLDPASIQPANFIEGIAFGTGSAVAFMASMIVGGAVGAAGGEEVAGPPGAVVGGVVGAYTMDYAIEKSVLARELMDAGYDANFVDRVSNWYAVPVAAIDFVSFGFMGKLLRPIAVQAAKKSIAKSVLRAALTKGGQVALATAKGLVFEGGTEAVQTRIQTEFEIALKVKDRNFQDDLVNDVSSFVIGGLIGGVAGAAGQINSRREQITNLSKKFDIPRDTVAQLYDESVLRANDMFYDELIQQANVENQMALIEKAFAKADGKTVETQADVVEEVTTPSAFAAVQDLIDAETILVDAKTKAIQTEVKSLTKEREALNQKIVEQTQAKATADIVKPKVKLDEISKKLDAAQQQYAQAIASDPKLKAIWDKLDIAKAELTAATTENERAAESRSITGYMRDESSLSSVILSEGGIASDKKGDLKAEYRENVPITIRRDRGLSLDVMAATLAENYPQFGITDTNSLLAALARETDISAQEKVPKPTRTSKENIQKLKDRISALETKMEGVNQQDIVKIAEAKVVKVTELLTTSFERLVELEVIQDALRVNPELSFSQEMGRPPVDKVELNAWRVKHEADLVNQKTVLQKQAEALTREILSAESIAEAYRQGLLQVSGQVALSASQVRQMAKQDLRNVMQAYKSGIKMSEGSFKAIQKSFLAVLGDIKLSDKAKTRLLRKVLTIRSAAQFNAKIGSIVDGINTILRSEIVKDLQTLGNKVLDKMSVKEQNVAPQAQVMAEHLRRITLGTAPLNYDIQSSDPVELARAIVEQAVYDLSNAGDDVGAAKRAYKTVQDFYRDQLQSYADFKARADATYGRLAEMVAIGVKESGGGFTLDATKEALDGVRQQSKRGGIMRSFSLDPYTLSFMSILDMLDKKSGTPSMQGPLAREFNSEKPYQAWIVHTDWSKQQIDGKLQEIYGKDALQAWAPNIGENFLDVKVMEETIDPITKEKVPSERMINIPRSVAMSLWLMTKMPTTRMDLVNMGISEIWLEEFENGTNVNFTEKDYQWMQNVRETLDAYAEKIAPIYERLTGKPFRRIDNYFMLSRFLNQSLEEGGLSENSGIIDAMLNGEFEKLSVTDSDRFKQRTKSKMLLQFPDIYQALSRYALDMNHFLGYADYVVKLQKAFQSDEIRRSMEVNLPPSIAPVIKEYIDTLATGSVSRIADRSAMKGLFKVLGLYARNQVAPIKNVPRQFSAVAAFTQYEGMGALELANAALDLQRASKSGELAHLLDTAYMRQRYEGLYEFAVQYAQDMAHAEYFSSFKDKGVLGPIRRALSSQTVHNLVTWSARFGDRAASVVGGWAMYQKILKETGNVNAAIAEAIHVIEETQQTQDPGKLPVAFTRGDSLPGRLLTIFKRTQAIYFDTYIRMHKAHNDGRISHAQFIRAMLTWHFWVPIFEVMVTSGEPPWETPAETTIAVLAGPLSMALIFGQMVASIIAGVVEGISDEGEELPAYLKDVSDSTLVGSFARDLVKLSKKIVEMVQYPDYETMWGGWKAAMGVAEVGPVPTGWLAGQAPEGIYTMLEGDFYRGAKKVLGYPESRTKEK